MKKQNMGETVFCILYLLFAYTAFIIFLVNAGKNQVFLLFALLTLTLAGGDSFHLIPRIVSTFKPGFKNYNFWSGLGLLISSVTMTLFYIVLVIIFEKLFPDLNYPHFLIYLIYILGIIRIVLCFFKENNWFEPEGNLKWSIYRSFPFLILGLIEAYLFFLTGNLHDYHMWQMGLAIIVSFACYIPVTLFAKKKPIVGMLMIPKTLAYVWMISLGLSLIGKF